MTALVFMDTETTGLSLDDDIWEFAAIRREPDGTETSTHLFIEHNLGKCSQLPESFLADHHARFPSHDRLCGGELVRDGVHTRNYAADKIERLFYDRPHVVGAVPNFDTERLALLLGRYGHKPGWHYHLIDVENLAVGYLAGLRAAGAAGRAAQRDRLLRHGLPQRRRVVADHRHRSSERLPARHPPARRRDRRRHRRGQVSGRRH